MWPFPNEASRAGVLRTLGSGLRARRLLALGILVALSGHAPAAATDARQYRFGVYLDNMPVGYHRVVVKRDGDDLRVESDARFEVRVLSVPVFHYRHHATEHWRAGCLRSLTATTDDNGKQRTVDAMSDGEVLRVHSARGEQDLQGCVLTYAYWNPAFLGHSTQLLNAQTGEYQSIKVTNLPDEALALAGKSVVARHYRIDTGRHEIDLWYSPEGRWLGLESVIAFGRRLRYRPE